MLAHYHHYWVQGGHEKTGIDHQSLINQKQIIKEIKWVSKSSTCWFPAHWLYNVSRTWPNMEPFNLSKPFIVTKMSWIKTCLRESLTIHTKIENNSPHVTAKATKVGTIELTQLLVLLWCLLAVKYFYLYWLFRKTFFIWWQFLCQVCVLP